MLCFAISFLTFATETWASAEPAAIFKTLEQASAEWSLRRDGHIESYEVRVTRVTRESPEKTFARAEISRRRCPGRAGPPRGHDLICVTYKTFTIDLTPQEFWVDPGLNLARLSTKMKGKTVDVEWRGSGSQPIPGVVPHIEDESVETYAEIARRATPSGDVLGQSIPDRPDRSWGVLRIMTHAAASVL